MFADPDQPTPAACALGAIHMVALRTAATVDSGEHATSVRLFNAAVGVLADHLHVFYGVGECLADEPETAEQMVSEWNDQRDRIVSHVIAALYGGAEQWEHTHGGGA
jgi:hypothetical protein